MKPARSIAGHPAGHAPNPEASLARPGGFLLRRTMNSEPQPFPRRFRLTSATIGKSGMSVY